MVYRNTPVPVPPPPPAVPMVPWWRALVELVVG